MTNPHRTAMVFRDTVDHLGLDQFATSIAALAHDEATPLAVLENVLSAIADNLNESNASGAYNVERLLNEKAQAYGYDNIDDFRQNLVKTIGERMVDLHISQLSAPFRKAGSRS